MHANGLRRRSIGEAIDFDESKVAQLVLVRSPGAGGGRIGRPIGGGERGGERGGIEVFRSRPNVQRPCTWSVSRTPQSIAWVASSSPCAPRLLGPSPRLVPSLLVPRHLSCSVHVTWHLEPSNLGALDVSVCVKAHKLRESSSNNIRSLWGSL